MLDRPRGSSHASSLQSIFSRGEGSSGGVSSLTLANDEGSRVGNVGSISSESGRPHESGDTYEAWLESDAPLMVLQVSGGFPRPMMHLVIWSRGMLRVTCGYTPAPNSSLESLPFVSDDQRMSTINSLYEVG